MPDPKLTRRAFVRNTSLWAVGGIATVLPGDARAAGAPAFAGFDLAPDPEEGRPSKEAAKILNHNPQMRYRRLGKTGLMVSEVSLGGHWANRTGGRYWAKFDAEEAPADVVANRKEVIARAIERGINYLDITTSAECLAYGAALEGRRDRMFVAADDSELAPREDGRTNVAHQLENVETSLRRLRTDYLDVWRPMFRQDGAHTDAHVEAVVEAFEKAKAQGKVRWLGMTSHNREFVEHVVESFPKICVVYFPYTAKSKVKAADLKSIDPAQIEEVGTGDGVYSGDTRKGIFQAAVKHDIGVVTIKPFAGGSLFSTKLKFGESLESTEEDYERARLTLACILANPAISTTIPGMTTVEQVDNNARASAERLALLEPGGARKLAEATDALWARLPEEYGWLRDWEWI